MFMLFPVLLNYFSPYLIVEGSASGILSGSAITFAILFVGSLFLGRAWCGWLCPAAGLQEAVFFIQDRKASQKGNWIKWLIWVPWIALILFGFIHAGGIRQVNPLLHTEQIISVVDKWNYIIYYFVIGTVFILSLAAGKRAFCHYACWMAPFMIIGRTFRNLGRWPSLRLQANRESCTDCLTCVRNCPMSLDVNAMVHSPSMENKECILCGNCVDHCSKGVIRYVFKAG